MWALSVNYAISYTSYVHITRTEDWKVEIKIQWYKSVVKQYSTKKTADMYVKVI